MPEHVVDVAWLARHREDGNVVVADVRWYLVGPRRGADAFAEGHIPGAHFVDLDTDLSSPRNRGPGRHPLPSVDRFAACLARIGVTPASTVVAYDDRKGAIAARMWWLLRYFGLANAGRVLRGGIDAWRDAGMPLETDLPQAVSASHMTLTPRAELVVDAEAVARSSGTVLDARATDRFRGDHEPVDPRPGHIPNARSAPLAGNMAADGTFLPPSELKQRYSDLGVREGQEVICYCGSGVTACHNLLALSMIGRDDARLYEGSWSDWSSDPERPVATGD